MVKTDREIEEIIQIFQREVRELGITPQQIILFGSYPTGTPREGSHIDLVEIADDFRRMTLREQLELFGIAAGSLNRLKAWVIQQKNLKKARTNRSSGQFCNQHRHCLPT
jgi:predicted nucleotidyltransferase